MLGKMRYIQSCYVQQFVSTCKYNLTSLRKFYCPTGMSGQQINVGNVVLVHDDCPLTNWMMAVVEGFMTGSDGLACSVSMQTINGVTNHAKFYSLKKILVVLLQMVEETVDRLDCPLTTKCPHHKDQHAGQQLAEWTKIICAHPVNVRDC